MAGRGAAVLFALVLGGRAFLQQPAPVQQPPHPPDLFTATDPLAITLEAPLHELFAKDDNEDVSVPGIVSYKDPSSGSEVKREAQVSVRGHTSRRETECTFPKLKLKFKEGDVLKIGTHCGEASDEALSPKYGRLANEKSPQREALVYRLLQAADVPTLRARPASVTYMESGQPPLTRKALLVEDDDEKANQAIRR